ncbi:hypothetical protein STCU_10635 [Strigomonas culicis]|uniref:Uncharacterized protein n=1 Tax=Strigomonas culicis TaxID=28005 RepID=S9TM18_9TRYP|nr:hypothetical protein STCU_10635 [Strigomonas culicis]|eukprot:EPY17408.1 hypothetical protein STCU_10635 [Strigomonas culicis]
MSFRNEDPAPVNIWSNSQGATSLCNEGSFQQYEGMPMQQIEPRGSFMRQASSGGLNERRFSSNQMQYANLEGNGSFGGYN